MLIDTHCHLHDIEKFPDPEAEIAFAREQGVERIVVVGVEPSDWPTAVQFAERFTSVHAIVGWHPNYTANYGPESLKELAELLAHPKVLALGEIGLDYHWDYAPRDLQFAALKDQLDLADSLDLPVVFHAREAYSDLLDVLESRPKGRKYLFHCFAGTTEEAKRAVSLGGILGVDGPVSYKSADALRETLRAVGAQNLVLETDSPYMSPVPFRGKPNRPGHVRLVAEALADALSLPVEELSRVTAANAERFFGSRLVQ